MYLDHAQVYLIELLKEYKAMAASQRREIAAMPPGQLTKWERDGRTNYIQLIESNGKRTKVGITKNKAMIACLARKKYLQISLAQLEKNVVALENCLKKHDSVAPHHIINRMPDTYGQLPITTFLPEKRRGNAWANATFEQSTLKLEERKHITASGLTVRSKSEVIIADRLAFYKIPFRYEQMIYIENHSFSPDFVILKGKKLFYWEHCGLVSDKRYMSAHKWKLEMYEKAGIVPWDNLIVTYDDQYGNLDVRVIDAEIQNKLI